MFIRLQKCKRFQSCSLVTLDRKSDGIRIRFNKIDARSTKMIFNDDVTDFSCVPPHILQMKGKCIGYSVLQLLKTGVISKRS